MRAITRGSSQTGSVYVANRDGTGLRQVFRVGRLVHAWLSGAVNFLSWSPDGRRLAYGNGPLYVLNSNGTKQP